MHASIPSSVLEKFTTFGDLLRFLRRRAGMTQMELSIQVGYSDAQISRLEQNLRIPDIPTLEARFVPALDMQDEPQAIALMLKLAASIRQVDVQALGQCPYKGLDFFDESDAGVFVGREALSVRLRESVLALSAGSERFFAIVGASGSGKSSLARAGLAPALRKSPCTAGWQYHIFTPGSHPLEALAVSLMPDSGSVAEAASLAEDLRREQRSLEFFGRREAKLDRVSHILLVVDQFEELFALCRSESERTAFIDNLLAAATAGDGQVVVVITLRADFYAACAGYPQLREALAAHQEYIGAMSDEELRRAIEEPARRCQWDFEPGLVELILHDVGHEPGALPLLSHALYETWQRRRGRTLTFSGYESAGGVTGAIAETAEAVFIDRFNRQQQAIARRIFLRLTELGDETATGDTRRQASFSELILKPEDAEATQGVLKALADARLITTSQDSAQVAHEALIREWPTLRGWLEENREGLRLQRHLTEAAQEWAASNNGPDLLYRGARLAQAREWAAAHGEDLNDQEREFLAAAQAQAEREAAEREAQRQAAERARLAALAYNSYYGIQGGELTTLLALRSLLHYGYSPEADVALTKGLQRGFTQKKHEQQAGFVYQIAPLAQKDHFLVTTLWGIEIWDAAMDIIIQLTWDCNGNILGAASPDGTQVVTDESGELYLRDAASGQYIRKIATDTAPIQDVAFSPDGRSVATVDSDKFGHIWDLESGREMQRFQHQDALAAVKFSPDGKTLLTGGKALVLWDVQTGARLRQFSGHSDWIKSVDFSPDGKWIASASSDKTARIWEAATGRLVRTIQQDYAVFTAVFSPDGRHLLTGGLDGLARLWDVTYGVQVKDFVGHTQPILCAAFLPDGRRFISGGEDGDENIWNINLDLGPRFIASAQTGPTGPVEFSADTRYAGYVSNQGTAVVLDLSTGQTRLQIPRADYPDPDTTPLGNQWSFVNGRVVFSQDGKLFAAVYNDYSAHNLTAIVWDLQTGEEIHRFTEETGWLLGVWVQFSPDGRYVAMEGTNHIIVWDMQTGQRVSYLVVTNGTNIIFSNDGKYLALAIGEYSTIQQLLIVETASWKIIRRMGCQGYWVNDLDFSPDGKTLLAACFLPVSSAFTTNRTTIVQFSVETGKQTLAFQGAPEQTFTARFSHDGSYIATASGDKTARIWDAATGHEVRRFTVDVGFPLIARFSADDSYLYTFNIISQFNATATSVSSIWAYPVDLQAQIQQARAALPRDFTAEERARYGITDDTPTCPEADSVKP